MMGDHGCRGRAQRLDDITVSLVPCRIVITLVPFRIVITGLVPVIHVDGRHKAGHDE